MKQQPPSLLFSTHLLKKWTQGYNLRDRSEPSAEQELRAKQERSVAESKVSGLQIIEQLFKTTSSVSFDSFHSRFVFGTPMRIWRKGRVKEVVVFTDNYIPNLLWVSSNTKAFLFDLCYTTILNLDLDLKLTNEVPHYFVLSYFQQKIPFVFDDVASLKKFRTLFQCGVFHYEKLKPTYPPYLSKLTKYYIVAEMAQGGSRVNSVAQLLKIAELLVGSDNRPLYEDILRELVHQSHRKAHNHTHIRNDNSHNHNNNHNNNHNINNNNNNNNINNNNNHNHIKIQYNSSIQQNHNHSSLQDNHHNSSQMQQNRERGGSSQDFESSVLSVDQVMDFFKIACCNQNLKAIYENYADIPLAKKSHYTIPFMNQQRFKTFLKAEQNQSEQAAARTAHQLFPEGASFYQFCNFLLNKEYNYAAASARVNQNLPLNHYFCYSSHNTYLSGNQLTSDSKVERYLQDLQAGLKCLEIDVHEWDGQLIVTHALKGFHINKEVSFEEVIQQIGNYCKRTRFYPIILSLENRTSKPSYGKICAIFQKYLGPYLLNIHQDYRTDNFLRCRTLAELKNKVIIKADAKIKDILRLGSNQLTSIQLSQPLTISIKPANPSQHTKQISQTYQQQPLKQQPLKQQPLKQQLLKQQLLKQQLLKQDGKKQDGKTTQSSGPGVALEADQMVQVTALFKAEQGLSNKNSVGYQSTSITSRKLEKLDPSIAVEYTKKSFLRVYPEGTEIASGNYNPIPGLERGAQLIALNTQTKDDYAWLMMSYFTAGATCPPEHVGYVEKPLHLRTNQPRPTTTLKISISILSSLFKGRIRFFGSAQDMKANTDNTLTFEVRDFQVAFFMFEMDNGLKDCIPLRFIRQGYRVIAGRNKDYVDCGFRILLRVRIKRAPAEGLPLRLS